MNELLHLVYLKFNKKFEKIFFYLFFLFKLITKLVFFLNKNNVIKIWFVLNKIFHIFKQEVSISIGNLYSLLYNKPLFVK